MINLNLSMLIYHPIKQVFDFVSVPENDFQWQYGTLASARLSEDLNNVGAMFRSVGHLLGRRVQSVFEVTQYEQNKKYGYKSVSGPLQLHTSYTLEASGGGTKLNISTQANLVNLFQMDEHLLEKDMKKQLKENLAMLKNLLEAKRILAISNNNHLSMET